MLCCAVLCCAIVLNCLAPWPSGCLQPVMPFRIQGPKTACMAVPTVQEVCLPLCEFHFHSGCSVMIAHVLGQPVVVAVLFAILGCLRRRLSAAFCRPCIKKNDLSMAAVLHLMALMWLPSIVWSTFSAEPLSGPSAAILARFAASLGLGSRLMCQDCCQAMCSCSACNHNSCFSARR